MTIIRTRERLKRELQDKDLRDFFVSEHINIGLSFQIRALRKQRGWTQKKLAEKAGLKQSWIAKIENPNYSGFSLQTLKKLASVFDVALVVRFVPFGDLVQWELTLSSEKLEAVSFPEDPYFKETPQIAVTYVGSASLKPIVAQGFEYVGNIPLSVTPLSSYENEITKKPADFNKYWEARQKKMDRKVQRIMEERIYETAFG